MSNDVENEYFSDGVAEEVLNLLAKIPDLRVISRSSSFSFRGKDIDIPSIAEALNVALVLEGSVRRYGDQVRITAQLIEARSDTHLWSEPYDRELVDVFAKPMMPTSGADICWVKGTLAVLRVNSRRPYRSIRNTRSLMRNWRSPIG